MRKIAYMLVALALAVITGCSGGGDTPESVMREIAANVKEMGVILTGVTDEASAKAAVPKIEALRAKMRDAAGRAKKLPKIDDATEQRINADAEKALGESMPIIMAAQERLMGQPELMAILAPALEGMENDM